MRNKGVFIAGASLVGGSLLSMVLFKEMIVVFLAGLIVLVAGILLLIYKPPKPH